MQSFAQSMTSQSVFRALPFLACLIACSIINLFYFPPTPIFPDEHRFLASAARLAMTGEFWVGADRAWEMPGTALFFAPAVWLFGPDAAVVPIRIAQSILLIAQSALAATIARRIFGRGAVDVIAAILVALYPFFLFYQGLLLSETLFNTLLLAAIAALYWWRDRGLHIDAALVVTCLCFAAATYTKATLTILPPLLIAATAWTSGTQLRKALTVLLAASCLYGAFMSPWWIRNATVLGAFVPFATGAAQNLYIGNNPNNPNGGIDWASDVEPDVAKKIFAIPNEVERQRAFSKKAVDYIKRNPAAALRVAGKKFIRFWNVIPNASEFKTGLYAAVSAASFGPILLLALACAARWWRRWRFFVPIYLLVGYFTLIHVVTIASLRYRLPIEPFLIVMAAGMLCELFDALRARREHSVRMSA
jgi:4-amino-4-deoxy-L-arabinose transferase-like glycosyltransferase